MATRDEVISILRLFKGCIMLDRLMVKGRQENTQGLIDLGITPDQRREILLGLTPDNYSAGPKPDDTDYTKEIWEFGCEVGGMEVYIKLRVVPDPRKKSVFHAMLWSFHRARHPMKYPLRGVER